MDYRDFLGKIFKCECGDTHEVRTQEIVIDGGAISSLSQIMDRYKMPFNVFVVADDNVSVYVPATGGGDPVSFIVGGGGIITNVGDTVFEVTPAGVDISWDGIPLFVIDVCKYSDSLEGAFTTFITADGSLINIYVTKDMSISPR